MMRVFTDGALSGVLGSGIGEGRDDLDDLQADRSSGPGPRTRSTPHPIAPVPARLSVDNPHG